VLVLYCLTSGYSFHVWSNTERKITDNTNTMAYVMLINVISLSIVYNAVGSGSCSDNGLSCLNMH